MISPPFYFRGEIRKMILIRIALCIYVKRGKNNNNSIDLVFEVWDLNPGRQLGFEIFLLTELLLRYNNFSPEV